MVYRSLFEWIFIIFHVCIKCELAHDVTDTFNFDKGEENINATLSSMTNFARTLCNISTLIINNHTNRSTFFQMFFKQPLLHCSHQHTPPPRLSMPGLSALHLLIPTITTAYQTRLQTPPHPIITLRSTPQYSITALRHTHNNPLHSTILPHNAPPHSTTELRHTHNTPPHFTILRYTPKQHSAEKKFAPIVF